MSQEQLLLLALQLNLIIKSDMKPISHNDMSLVMNLAMNLELCPVNEVNEVNEVHEVNENNIFECNLIIDKIARNLYINNFKLLVDHPEFQYLTQKIKNKLIGSREYPIDII